MNSSMPSSPSTWPVGALKPSLVLAAALSLMACGPLDPPAPPEAARDAELEQSVSTQALPANHYILFIRGLDPSFNRAAYDNNSRIPQGCDSYWSSAIQFFGNQGWSSRIRTIGIYSKQPTGSCYVNLADVTPNQEASSTIFQGANPLTNDTSIGALGHRLAWWIYNNYTSKGYTVSLVGHSMGGLVARVAVGASAKRLSGFPPPLLVKGLVLLSTPNNGASASYLGGLTGCGTQCAQMNNNSTLLTSLNTTWDNGNSGVTNRLNLIGSNDYVVGDVRSGAYGGVGSAAYYISPAYDHGSILNDQGTSSDADIGWWQDRTQAYTQNPPPAFRAQPRSLQWTFNWATAQ